MDTENVKLKVTKFFKGKKSLEFVIAVIVVAVIAAIYLSTLSEPSNTGSGGANKSELSEEAEETETKLGRILSQIKGAGKVEVMITYETGPEIVPAMNVSNQSSSAVSSGSGTNNESQTENSTPVTVQQQSGSEPLVIVEKQPKVRGVVVVAEGADDLRVKLALQQATKTVLDVSLDNIDVFTMKSK